MKILSNSNIEDTSTNVVEGIKNKGSLAGYLNSLSQDLREKKLEAFRQEANEEEVEESQFGEELNNRPDIQRIEGLIPTVTETSKFINQAPSAFRNQFKILNNTSNQALYVYLESTASNPTPSNNWKSTSLS